MKKIERKVVLDEDIIKYIPENAVFLDIETTGFSHVTNRIYLIGMLAKVDGEYRIIQLLTEIKEDEKLLLEEFSRIISKFDVIITFNGDTFDLKFIKSRMNKFRLNSNFEEKISFDLLRYVKEEGFLLELESKKLKALERYLGIFREDTFTGGELISLYYEYEVYHDENLEKLLLLHNAEDIENLPKLFKFIDIIDEKNTLISRDNSFRIESLGLSRNVLRIGGKSSLSDAYYNFGEWGELSVSESKFEFKKILKLGNYNESTKCVYLELDGHSISCKYNIVTPENMLIIKYDKNLLYLNAVEYFKYFLENYI